MIVPFGPWLPDQPRYNNPCITATNVYPIQNGYGPFPDATVFSDALSEAPKGVISFRQVSGKRETFVGTETAIYRLNGSAWDDVSNSSGFSNTENWRFAVYGSRVIATNGEDNPQKFDLDTDTAFSDLTNAPKHRFPIVIRDVLVALDLTDGSGNQIAFSAVNDSESWDVLSGGGTQEFYEGGPVVGGTGGEFGVILQQEGVVRMNFVGGDLRFTFDRIEGGTGCSDPASIVTYKGSTFYLGPNGFQRFDGAQSLNISTEKVSKTFFELSTSSVLVTSGDENRVTEAGDTRVVNDSSAVQGALDPKNSCVVWSYPTTTGRALIVYNYQLDKWSSSDADVNYLHSSLRADGPVLAGFDSSDQLVLFTGSPRTAVVSTGDLQLMKDRGSMITSVRGLVDAAHDVTVAKKYDLADTESTATASSNSRGKCSLRSGGRYQRIQVSPTATFTEITGAELEVRSGSKV